MDSAYPRTTPMTTIGWANAGRRQLLTAKGHTCYVERGAAWEAGFSDENYQKPAGNCLFRRRSLYARRPGRQSGPADCRKNSTGCAKAKPSWVPHLASAQPDKVQAPSAKHITAIAYELDRSPGRDVAILAIMSPVAGRMLPQIAGTLLQANHGGKGILLGGVPGVRRPRSSSWRSTLARMPPAPSWHRRQRLRARP